MGRRRHSQRAPELLICATAQRIGLSGNGIAAESFTISAREVSIGDVVVPTEDYLAALPPSLADEFTISSWQAITGAAFSSAMGRFGFGSTNALLAALNIDLGAWLPNPRLVTRGYRDFPRVRLPYMAKEILGVYDDYEEYVFVADGGQWENLGLVELLRRRCQTIICVDASGDTVGSFRTLLQAIDLAGTELGGKARIDVDLRELRAPAEALPKTAIASWPIVYADRAEPGRLLYAKAQVSADADLELQRFAKTDRKFPNYSTAKQNLKDGQFRALVSMGKQAGKRLADLYEGLHVRRAAAAPAVTTSVSPVHVVGFDHVVLNVADLERALSFYCDRLGLTGERVDEWRDGTAPFPSARVQRDHGDRLRRRAAHRGERGPPLPRHRADRLRRAEGQRSLRRRRGPGHALGCPRSRHLPLHPRPRRQHRRAPLLPRLTRTTNRRQQPSLYVR